MRTALLALALALVACGRSAPTAPAEVDLRNTRAVPVTVRPWDGADPVTIQPGRAVVVRGEAPTGAWTVRVTAGGRTTEHTLRRNGATAVLVTDGGVAVDPTRDGLDVAPETDPETED